MFSRQHVNILLKNIRQSLVSPAKSGGPQRTELYTSYRSVKANYLGATSYSTRGSILQSIGNIKE